MIEDPFFFLRRGTRPDDGFRRCETEIDRGRGQVTCRIDDEILHVAAGLTDLPEEVHMALGIFTLLPIGGGKGSAHGQAGERPGATSATTRSADRSNLMIVITTPTGQIGGKLVARLLDRDEAVRVIVRDASRLDATAAERVEVVEGSHDDPAVLDRALPGAEALFWLVPPDRQAPSARARYLEFARVGAEAIRRHDVGHVVAVSSAGHEWPQPAGLLSAAFAMDGELKRSGAAYRALSMPFYMENLLGQLDAICHQGAFHLTLSHNRPLATIATDDIAETAAALLTDLSWTGQENLPVFGPDRLTPDDMAGVLSDVLDRPVAYRQTTLEDFAATMASRGASEQTIHDLTDMFAAQDAGIYEADWTAAKPASTSFRSWCEQVLRPAAGA